MSDSIHKPIKLVPHKKEWTNFFDVEKKRIEGVLKKALGVEHIGSTSVPGIVAKPVIDVLVGIRSMDDAKKCIPPLRKIGYHKVRDRGDQRVRMFFIKEGAGGKEFHLHIVKYDGKLWRGHTAFVRYLRAHPIWAKKYEALKIRSAKKFAHDRHSYGKNKGAFVRKIIALAMKIDK